MFRPIGYRVTPKTLEIVRPVGCKVFGMAQVVSVNFPASEPAGAIIGICRVDGIYGSWGLYWNKSWDKFRVNVTNEANSVEILFKSGQRMIVSPDDPQGFIQKVQTVMG